MVSTARAQQLARRVGSEAMVGGITHAARAVQQNALRAQLKARRPAGTTNTPIRIELSPQDRATLAVQPNVNVPAPLRIGMTKSVPPGVEKVAGMAFGPDMPGKFQVTPDGGFTWAVTLSSPGAQAVRVRFTDFSLPPQAAMYFYSPEGAAYGPYVGKGRNGNGDFWTRSVSSDTGVIQLQFTGRGTMADRRKISFVISDLAHISGRVAARGQAVVLQVDDTWPCSNNARCVIDANCVSGTPADPAKNAIAKMEWIQGTSVFTCSGGLLADTAAATQIPYFLTANHCFNASISNLETWFNYTTDSCEGACPHNILTGGAPPSDTIGITVLRTGTVGDFTLARLDQAPPAGAVFLGWNTTPIAFSNGAQLHRISNPNFGPQAYSQHDVTTSAGTCLNITRGAWIYSDDITGATMGGSSGSPVLNSAGEVVGQLTGCCGITCANVCLGAPQNATIDGAFASYFAQIDDLLDPQIVGACCVTPLCSIDTAANCSASGGSYLGDATDCGSGEAGNPTIYPRSPGLAIPDGGGPGNAAVDTINVPDAFVVGDVDIDLDITHTWVGDLTVTLSHLGTTVTVLDRPGVPASAFGCDLDNYNNIILDDEGTGGAIENACAANLSSPPNYTPNNSLSAFDGMNSDGDWVITVFDSATPDPGILNNWSLHIDQTASNPCTGQCSINADCDDNLFCNGAETCSGGSCQPGPAVCTASCEHCDEAASVCELCSTDLDGNGTIDANDISLLTGCFGACYTSGDPCAVANIDGDPGGCVGTGDYSALVGCMNQTCGACSNCTGPPAAVSVNRGADREGRVAPGDR